MNKKLIKFLKIFGIVILVLYATVCALLYFNQDDLLFHPQPNTPKEVAEILKQYPEFDTLSFVMKDGNRTCGYISKDTITKKLPLVIYFGGNAEEVSHLSEKYKYFPNTIMVLMNYRSFGLSQGVISEKSMFSDALEIYDKLVANPKVDANNVIVMGRSMGTGVATYVSSQRKTNATVLITPYESIIDVAQEKYPFVPISWFIKHPFKSKEYAASITTPVLSLIAKNDQVIPPHHAHHLMEAWKGNTEVFEVNEDHSTIMKNEEVWKRIEGFVKGNIAVK
ncbi:MAG TPA: dienelactone hydrolase family protein [Bacteroidia bacterium]|nr:dienelactone hydrolase family protein [Bacteroidia bacterium]